MNPLICNKCGGQMVATNVPDLFECEECGHSYSATED